MKKRRLSAMAVLLLLCPLFVGCSSGAGGLLRGLIGSSGSSGGLLAEFAQQGNEGVDNGGFAPTGACCLTSGDCLSVSAADCASFAGVFHGPGLTCGVAPCSSRF